MSVRKQLIKKRGERKVRRPDKTIKVELDFWTNDIASDKSKVVPKVCWDFGMIHILENQGHGLKAKRNIPFYFLTELASKIEESFEGAGIKMLKHHPVYYADQEEQK